MSKKMNWIFLILAGIFEVVWAIGLKYCDGFKLTPALMITVSGSLLSMICLGLAIRTIPMGVAYAIWTGMGVVGITIYGIIFLGEAIDITKIVFLSMIFIGVLGLKLTVVP
jgi:quaternary ammonium compound-resistance protein SugE